MQVIESKFEIFYVSETVYLSFYRLDFVVIPLLMYQNKAIVMVVVVVVVADLLFSA